MGLPTTYRDVIAWREAMALAADIYRATAGFPRDEAFGLITELRQAALLVPSYLAEGTTRDTVTELAQFLAMSCGSVAALETQLEIAVGLGYLAADSAAVTRTRRVGGLLSTLRETLREEATEERSFSDPACANGKQQGNYARAHQYRSPVTSHRSRSSTW